MSEVEAEKALVKYHQLQNFTVDKVEKAVSSWSKVEITVDDLRQFPWMLLRSNDFVRKRCNQLSESKSLRKGCERLPSWAKCPLIGAFPFKRIKFSVEQFARSGDNSVEYLKSFSDRVDYYAKVLEMDEFHVIRQCMRFPHLFSLPMEAIERMTTLLRDAGVTAEEMQADLWVFKHNYDLARQRVEFAQMKQLKFKTWMARAPEITMKNSINRTESFREVLGDNDMFGYLQEKLECSGDEVLFMQTRNVQLMTTNPVNLKKRIDLLISEGFNRSEIIWCSRVLQFSVQHLSERISQLKSWGVPLSLFLLTLSRRDFKRRYKRYLENDRNKLTPNSMKQSTRRLG
ncbi:hypothetical protein HDE_01175 [Halotydeus destructor]|nr:hypothetical protein HDE_01175 [Halotydeus destructor]